MEQFKIEESYRVEVKNLHLFNQPFEITKKMDDFRALRISSYHDPEFNEPNWLKYDRLFSTGVVEVVSSSSDFFKKEALCFMSEQNAIGLTRDNLFMLSFLFPKILDIYESKDIIAPMCSSLLPVHHNGPKILPLVGIVESGRINYDWFWADTQKFSAEKTLFVYFKPTLTPY
jgi:hypothetical protein